MKKSLKDWQEDIYAWAESKGWNTDDRSEGEWAALAHTEISEAFESYRSNEPPHFHNANGKPEGAAVEYADLIIRVLHWAEAHGVNMDELVAEKMDYNRGRPWRHGNKLA